MRSGVATFVAMRHMNDRFIRLYRTIDLRDRYLSMYSTTLAMSHCGLNLVKGSRDNFWVFFFKILKIIIIKYRYQHAILIFKFFFDFDQFVYEELYSHSFKKLTLNHILSSLFNIFFLLLSLTPSPLPPPFCFVFDLVFHFFIC